MAEEQITAVLVSRLVGLRFFLPVPKVLSVHTVAHACLGDMELDAAEQRGPIHQDIVGARSPICLQRVWQDSLSQRATHRQTRGRTAYAFPGEQGAPEGWPQATARPVFILPKSVTPAIQKFPAAKSKIRVAELLVSPPHLLDVSGFELVVRIEKEQQLAMRSFKTKVKSRELTTVGFRDEPDPRVP